MSIFKSCKLLMLPINRKPVGGDIVLNITNNVLFVISESTIYAWDNCDHLIPQQLYITSDDMIEEGDWCIWKNQVFKVDSNNAYSNTNNITLGYCSQFPKNVNKIIATNTILSYDTDYHMEKTTKIEKICYNFNIPKIPETFITYIINQYNKGNIIENVVVEYVAGRLKSYGRGFTPSGIKINQDNTITINI